MDTCEKCDVPLLVSRDHNWEANGVISIAASPKNRMVFYESGNIDQLFRGIEELIGKPIEHIVIESRRREVKRYVERVIPGDVREAVVRMREAEKAGSDGASALATGEREALRATIMTATQSIIAISKAYGYGDQRASDLWESGGDYPWRILTTRNPYSLLNAVADNLGSVEACEGADMRVRYEQMGENAYKIEVYPGEHPIGLKERLKRRRYEFKPGDIHWERCPECGIPLDVAACVWDLAEGTITERATGRRMAIFGPSAMDSIVDDLEAELGDAIPEAVIEAQRRHVKKVRAADQWNKDGPSFQHMIALRGLGNLVDFEGDRTHLTLSIQNACFHLPMVGLIQALVELAYRVDSSTCEWELAGDGDLAVTVIVK